MANPTKKAGKPLAIRVAADSALARLTEGKPFTETVHKMADLFEQMLAADAALPVTEPTSRDQQRAHARNYAEAQTQGGAEFARRAESVRRADAENPTFVVTEPDGFTKVERTAREVLELAREQYPAGLVPVGLDDDDAGFEAGVSQDGDTAADDGDDDDLSYLA